MPSALDALDVLPEVEDPRSAAVELLRGRHDDFAASGERVLPPYTVLLPREWRDDAEATRAATWRCEAMADVGSLDVETRRARETMDEVSQAKDDFEFYESCPGERDWWRVPTDHDGVPVGSIVLSATPYHRNVGYLGVLPGHRGQGLVDNLLGEVTRIHAAAGADRITATTDMTNLTMVAAFDRAGLPGHRDPAGPRGAALTRARPSVAGDRLACGEGRSEGRAVQLSQCRQRQDSGGVPVGDALQHPPPALLVRPASPQRLRTPARRCAADRCVIDHPVTTIRG